MTSKTFTVSGEVHDALMGVAYRRRENPETILKWAVVLIEIVDQEVVKGNHIVSVDKDGQPQVKINVF